MTGDFSFEQVKDAGADGLFNTGDDTKVIRIGASNEVDDALGQLNVWHSPHPSH